MSSIRTERMQETPSSSALNVPIRLVVLEGKAERREFMLQEGTVFVGSRSDCALVLDEPTVSRRHARIERVEEGVRITDLGSTNGTRYLGARVASVTLKVGSSILFGTARVAFLPGNEPLPELSARTELEGIVGHSLAMRRLFAQIERVAATDVSVLIQGETGTGKEVVARAIHNLSNRASKPFRPFDCAALQPELVSSELFGHVKGAFTGAQEARTGAVEQANGGTLFLDEVGELPRSLQPVLLRVLESGTFVPVGGGDERQSNFRVLSATHVDLERASQEGRVREALWHRLAVVSLRIPPLRERIEDLPALVTHFAKTRLKGPIRLSPETLGNMVAYEWPGNIRELRNTLERVFALGENNAAEKATEPVPFYEQRERALKAFERAYLESLLAEHDGNVNAAARTAKVARSYLHRLVLSHGLIPKGQK